MYRITIIAALGLCLAFAAVTGCKQTPQKPAEGAQATKAYTATDAEREAVKREAEEAYLEGVLARQADDLKAARDAFARAVQLDPEYIEALKALADVKVALGEAAPPAAEQAMGMQKLEAQLQQTRQEVHTLMSQARDYYQREKFEDAIKALKEALDTMTLATKLYNMDFGAERPDAEDLLKSARIQQEVFAKAQDTERRTAAQQALEGELAKQAAYRHETAAQLLKTAREELAKKNFSQASRFARHALEADPGNVEAMELLNIVSEQRINFENERAILQKNIEWRKLFQDMDEAAIPPDERMPVHWEDKNKWEAMTETRRRSSEQQTKVFQPTAEQEKINKILDETKVRLLNIEDQPFPSAVKTLMRQFNVVPIVIHPDALAKLTGVNVSLSRPTETSLRQALEYLLGRIPTDAGQFSYVIKDEAVLITLRGAEENRSLIIYPVQDLLRKPVGFKAQALKFNKEDLFADVTGTTGTSGTTETDDEAGDPERNGTKDFYDPGDEQGLKDLIMNTVGGPDAWNFAGGSVGAPSTIDFRKGDMYITATEPVHQEVQRILGQLHYTSDVLVTLEARFLKVEETLLEEIGVDLTGFPTAAQQASASELGLVFTDPFLQGLLNDVTNVPSTGLFFAKRGAGVGFIPSGTGGGGSLIFLPSGVPSGDALGLSSQNILDSSLATALSNAGGLRAGFSFGPGNSNINFVLNALENSSRSSLLAAPKITTYNLQTAYISIRTEQTFVSGIRDVQVTTTAPPSYSLKLSKLKPGIQLTVKPTVTWDRKYVILEVVATSIAGTLPANKHVTLDLTPPAPTSTTTTTVPQPKLLVEFDFPVIDMDNIMTTVVIPDGGTVILGGLSNLQRIEGGATTPFLGDIPLLKFFFSTKGSTVSRSSLVILIRADITVVPEAEERFLEEN